MPLNPYGRPFRILSIDGGGLRGIVPVRIIQWIEQNITGKPIWDSFDLIAGTSTGGLIACALALKDETNPGQPKFNSQAIAELYASQASTIFPGTNNFFADKYTWTKNLWKPKYRPGGIEKVLQDSFGERRISDCMKPIFISSYDIRTHSPLHFSTRFCTLSSPAYNIHPDGNAKLKDICRASSAAPTFLPAHTFNYITDSGKNDTPHCIDGGVFINNPALAAFVEVLSNATDPVYTNRSGTEINENDIFILSLGTGKTSKSISIEEQKKWGVIKWGLPVIEIMMQGNSQTVDYQLSNLMKNGRYLRVDINIKKEFAGMDDARSSTRRYLEGEVEDQIGGNYLWTHMLTSFAKMARL